MIPAMEPPHVPLAAGQTLSHFRVIRKIGEGGMGVVFLARDEHLERDFALKVLPRFTPTWLRIDPRYRPLADHPRFRRLAGPASGR